MCVAALLCCANIVDAQAQSRSSKVIEAKSYKESGDTLKIKSINNDIYILTKNQINTSVVVDKAANKIDIIGGQENISRDLGQNLVVLNVDGITIVTKKVTLAPTTMSVATTAAPAPAPVVTAVEESAPAQPTVVATQPATTQPATTQPVATQSVQESPAKQSVEKTPSVATQSKSDSKFIETSVSVGLGALVYEDAVVSMNAKVRSTLHVVSMLRAGLAVSGDMYIFPAKSGLNSSDKIASISMANIMLAFDISLSDNNGFSFMPIGFTTDLGYGFGLKNNWYRGFTFNPGVVWGVGSNSFVSLDYKYQQFRPSSYGSGISINLGYKF